MSVAREGVGAQARAHARRDAARARASGARRSCRRGARNAHAALDLLRYARLSPQGAGHFLPAALGRRQLAANGQVRNGRRERRVRTRSRRRSPSSGRSRICRCIGNRRIRRKVEKAVSAVDPGAGVRDGRAAHHAAAALGRGRAGAGARRGRRARRQRREQPVRGRAGAQVGEPGVPAADGGQAVRHRARSPGQGQQGRARLQPGAGQGQRLTSSRSGPSCRSSPPTTPVRRPSPSSCSRQPTRSPPIAWRCWRRTTRTPPTSCASACGGCAAPCLPSAPCTTRRPCASSKATRGRWRAPSASCATPTC